MKCFTLLRMRRERDWTQAELAARAGLATQTISRIEIGALDNPGALTLKKIADVFGARVDEVFPELLGHERAAS